MRNKSRFIGIALAQVNRARGRHTRLEPSGANASIETARIDYTGNANEFDPSYIYGERTKAWVGGGEEIIGSLGVAVSRQLLNGNYVISTSLSFGIGAGTPISGGINNGWIFWGF